MVDNTTLSTGVGGDTIATDDIGGVKFQRIKLIHGVDGTNAGDVAATNPLPVTLSDTTATGTLGALNAFVTLITGGVGLPGLGGIGAWCGRLAARRLRSRSLQSNTHI